MKNKTLNCSSTAVATLDAVGKRTLTRIRSQYFYCACDGGYLLVIAQFQGWFLASVSDRPSLIESYRLVGLRSTGLLKFEQRKRRKLLGGLWTCRILRSSSQGIFSIPGMNHRSLLHTSRPVQDNISISATICLWREGVFQNPY